MSAQTRMLICTAEGVKCTGWAEGRAESGIRTRITASEGEKEEGKIPQYAVVFCSGGST